MPRGWSDRWKQVPGARRIRGGQGTSFVAQAHDGAPALVFVKVLNRQRDHRARGRFAREVGAYETLDVAGLPKLLEHNANEWRDASVPLYLVLEYIDGENIAEYVRRRGPLDIDTAVDCVSTLCEALSQCHDVDVVHRDLKPANVVLRSFDPRTPVIVDFGLSFNDAPDTPPDLTRVGEEIGNRFLRLPEHATGGRDPVSDVTQLAGILLYLLTGAEPRVLQDDAGNAPHQRDVCRARLEGQLSGRQLLRVQSLFDRAFDTRSTNRFASARDLRDALHSAVTLAPIDDDYDAIMTRLDDVTSQPRHINSSTTRQHLTEYLRFATSVVKTLAQEKHLQAFQSGQEIDATANVPHGATTLGMFSDSTQQRRVRYRFELRGETDVVLLIDDEEAWRGSGSLIFEVQTPIRKAAALAYLAQSSD
jgi:serine/threonine protein kinase